MVIVIFNAGHHCSTTPYVLATQPPQQKYRRRCKGLRNEMNCVHTYLLLTFSRRQSHFLLSYALTFFLLGKISNPVPRIERHQTRQTSKPNRWHLSFVYLRFSYHPWFEVGAIAILCNFIFILLWRWGRPSSELLVPITELTHINARH